MAMVIDQSNIMGPISVERGIGMNEVKPISIDSSGQARAYL